MPNVQKHNLGSIHIHNQYLRSPIIKIQIFKYYSTVVHIDKLFYTSLGPDTST